MAESRHARSVLELSGDGIHLRGDSFVSTRHANHALLATALGRGSSFLRFPHIRIWVDRAAPERGRSASLAFGACIPALGAVLHVQRTRFHPAFCKFYASLVSYTASMSRILSFRMFPPNQSLQPTRAARVDCSLRSQVCSYFLYSRRQNRSFYPTKESDSSSGVIVCFWIIRCSEDNPIFWL